MMAPWEFTRKYCKNCGSLLCGGIDDEEWRETCIYYNKELFGYPCGDCVLRHICKTQEFC